MSQPRIPKCMSTQHPDNVSMPFFSENAVIGGEDEIQETYYSFSHLGCDEQMWDCEGKEVDGFVVKKLLAKYGHYFREKVLGRDKFITLRVPNPEIERAEAKIVLETLESIPRSFDTAKTFYGDSAAAPVFQVILPMTTSAKAIDRIYRYYSQFVVGKKGRSLRDGDITVAEWIGDFQPERIDVIPLFEDMENMLLAGETVKEYLADKEDVRSQRVFLARSDPAMNYGLAGAVLLNKVALARLGRASEETGVGLFPIIGVGSAPFRGSLSPGNAGRVSEEYPSVHTFTIQSAFKYDHTPKEAGQAISFLEERRAGRPLEVDEEECVRVVRKYAAEYQRQVASLAPAINSVARHVPARRKRKLHVGLFGYSRSVGGITLPRAIKFTAALYSLGIPPELLGLTALDARDLEVVRESYVHFDDDLKEAVRFLNPDAGFVPEGLIGAIKAVVPDHGQDEAHREATGKISDILRRSDAEAGVTDLVLAAANARKFLG